MNTNLLRSFIVITFSLLLAPAHAQEFASPTNGQLVATFAGLSGNAAPVSGTLQTVVYSIYNQSIGQWWNGTTFTATAANLPTRIIGTNWFPALGAVLPAPCCGQSYQLAFTATDTGNNQQSANITVQADATPPVVAFSPLVDGQTVTNLSTLGGNVTDNFGLVKSVIFSIHELDPGGGPGRWWNGTNFQTDAVTLPATRSGTSWVAAASVVLPALNSGQSYTLSVTATDPNSNAATTTITVQTAITELVWDPGLTAAGTAVLANPNTNGGRYWFKIATQNTSVGAWRTALRVLAGDADVYLTQGGLPQTYSSSYASTRVGSDGFVLHSSQFSAGQDWFLLVNATTNAQWILLTGEAFAHNLGALATGDSSSTNVTIGPEGMAFFKTTVPSDTFAWRLGLNGATNQVLVRKSAAPHPYNNSSIRML